jgi:hypothetical protein
VGVAEVNDLHPITSPIRYNGSSSPSRYNGSLSPSRYNGSLSPSRYNGSLSPPPPPPLYSENVPFRDTQRSPYGDATDYCSDEVMMVHPERPHSPSFGKFNRALSYLAMKAPSTIDALWEEDNVNTSNAWLVLVEPR